MILCVLKLSCKAGVDCYRRMMPHKKAFISFVRMQQHHSSLSRFRLACYDEPNHNVGLDSSVNCQTSTILCQIENCYISDIYGHTHIYILVGIRYFE